MRDLEFHTAEYAKILKDCHPFKKGDVAMVFQKLEIQVSLIYTNSYSYTVPLTHVELVTKETHPECFL